MVAGGAVNPKNDDIVSVGSRVLKEARRFETIDRVLGWPLVANKLNDWHSTYTSIKQNDSIRLALGVVETLAAAYCRLLLLPLIRLPAVRTPLKVVDHFTSKFVRLVEAAAPRLRDQRDPMSVDGELLVTMIFLPLSMCLTVAHKILEGIARRLVSLFPPLKEAHRNFEQKGLIGQWMTLLLMVYLYLPLQFLSHPTETIQYFFSIPSRITWKVIEWNIGNVMMMVKEVGEWAQWTSHTFSNYIQLAQSVTVAVIDYWYYIVFRVTGLEEILASLLKMARDFLKRNDSAVAQFVNNLGQSAPCLWLSEVLSGSELAPVNFVKSVWNGESREELKTRPRTSRGARRQNSPPPQPVDAPAAAVN